jgi:hypothetical protein
MGKVIVEILVELLSAIALVTKQIKQKRPREYVLGYRSSWSNSIAVKLIKKLLGEKDVEEVLHRLDRLTMDEARNTGAQTLEVVYGLVANMRLVLDGEMTLSESSFVVERISPLGCEATADGIRKALGKSSTEISKRTSS